jgi:hypothetical protein
MGAGAVDRPVLAASSSSRRGFTCVEMTSFTNSNSKNLRKSALGSCPSGYRRRVGLSPSLNLPVVKLVDYRRVEDAETSLNAKFTCEEFEADVEEEQCVSRVRCEHFCPASDSPSDLLTAAPEFGQLPNFLWRWREDVQDRGRVEPTRRTRPPGRRGEPELYVVYECFPVVLLPAPSIDIPVPQRPLPIELPTDELGGDDAGEPPAKRRKVSCSSPSESIDDVS